MQADLSRAHATVTLAVFAVLTAGGLASAQSGSKPRKAKAEFDRLASRSIRKLELPATRSLAIRDLFDRGERAARDLARTVATDPRAEIVQIAAHILHDLGPRAAPAAAMLEQIVASGDPDRRTAARWALSAIAPSGVIVVAISGGAGSLKELDSKGKETASIPNLTGCFDAERLPNGRYLVACYTQRLIKEVDRKGKVYWKHQSKLRPMDVDRLPNGHTLIATIDGETLELDAKGKKVWSFKTKSSYEADRLPNGNTLISEFRNHRVIEVDRSGKIVWSHACKSPMDADRLPDGSTLIASFTDGVQLVDRDGRILRRFASPSCYSIKLLQDGAVLVTGNDGLRKYDGQNKLVWVQKLGVVGSVEVY